MMIEDSDLVSLELNQRDARFAKAYLAMAKFYRPQAPGDGMGHISLTKEQIKDHQRLADEARDYALRFAKEEDGLTFRIGCSNFNTNKAFVWAIEAARCLAGGDDPTAVKLLKMAVAEVEKEGCKKVY